MKIYTKTGDAGETGLFGGGRVSKDDPRVRAYGDVDEVNAAIGLAAALDPADFLAAALQTMQRDLFTIGAELATPDPAKMDTVRAKRGPPIGPAAVGALEDWIDAHETKLPPLRNFILPAGTPKAAAFHLARTTCRRAERSVVALSRDQTINPVIIHYLNRLSDLLFVLARAVNQQAGQADIAW
ncbi:MAG TPA: cob(I)yrinic acid a,c-diamide adenosyltransferase [Gemmatimonadales bacterium]|nr:cob(I)yrinic acid a,c-diamide adenosyltransferase [Gemmatimonadales bacterium]